jgi:hypothetical protein
MTRVVAVAGVIALGAVAATLAVAACRGQQSPPPSGGGTASAASPAPSERTAPTRATVTADHPTIRFLLHRQPDATVIRVQVTEIDNPTRQGLIVLATLRNSAEPAGEPIDLGRASLYPADRPAAFQFPLHGAAEALVHAADTTLTIIIAADPGTAALPRDVRLVVGVEVLAR